VESHRVVAAALLDGARVLLCHRSPDRRWYPNVWDFPGGHVQRGEHPTEALRRELLEELGVDIGESPCQAVHRIVRDDAQLDLTLFAVTSWTGTVTNRQPEEHDEIAWVAADDLASRTLADESYHAILQVLLAGEITRPGGAREGERASYASSRMRRSVRAITSPSTWPRGT
jgi:8-oxo-dGTP diphosphatase